MAKWKTKEIDILLENHGKLFANEIAVLLNRTTASVSKYIINHNMKLTEKQYLYLKKRNCEKTSKRDAEGIGDKNNNWKNGISTNHYHYKKIQEQRYPEKCLARKKVHNALRSGKLIKEVCSICGSVESFAHHEDYSKPLEVVWLCRKHHREVHGNKH